MSKLDMARALSCEVPEKNIPIWELEFHGWNLFSDKKAYFGTEFENLDDSKKNQAVKDNTEIIIDVAKRLHFSGITVPGWYWEVAPGDPAYLWLPDGYREQQITELVEAAGDDFMIIASPGGVMSMPGASDYVEFCYMLFDDPEKVDDIAKKVYEDGVECMKGLKKLGVDAVFTASDIADNRGLFFNPEQMDRYILPYLKDWSAEVKKEGMFSILHTDGNINDAIEDIVSTGVNAIQAIDPIAGMDIVKLKEQVNGRLCLCGNIDCGLLLTATPDEIEKVTIDTINNCKEGGGYVLGASNAVQQEVLADNYEAISHGWEKAGRLS